MFAGRQRCAQLPQQWHLRKHRRRLLLLLFARLYWLKVRVLHQSVRLTAVRSRPLHQLAQQHLPVPVLYGLHGSTMRSRCRRVPPQLLSHLLQQRHMHKHNWELHLPVPQRLHGLAVRASLGQLFLDALSKWRRLHQSRRRLIQMQLSARFHGRSVSNCGRPLSESTVSESGSVRELAYQSQLLQMQLFARLYGPAVRVFGRSVPAKPVQECGHLHQQINVVAAEQLLLSLPGRLHGLHM